MGGGGGMGEGGTTVRLAWERLHLIKSSEI